MGARNVIDEHEERGELIDLLREQLEVEGRLVGLYERTAPAIENRPVRHILHMIQPDSMKHIEICQAAIETLEGEDLLSEEKGVLVEGLREHVDLEAASIERADRMLRNVWVRENRGLEELLRKLRDDERRHHETLKRLAEKPFFRFDPRDFVVVMRGLEFAEERYRRQRERSGRAE